MCFCVSNPSSSLMLILWPSIYAHGNSFSMNNAQCDFLLPLCVQIYNQMIHTLRTVATRFSAWVSNANVQCVKIVNFDKVVVQHFYFKCTPNTIVKNFLPQNNVKKEPYNSMQ